MKKISSTILILTALIAIGSLSSCMRRCVYGSGHQVTEKRQMGNYTSVDVSGSFRVVIKHDSSSTISITADDNLMRYIKTTVTDGGLRIFISSHKNLCNTGEMTVHVPFRLLEGLRASDAAEIVSEGQMNAKDMFIHLSDGSRITLDLIASHVNTRANDASELRLTGKADSNDIRVSDGSHIYAYGFTAGSSMVQASDGSYGELNVLNSLDVRASDGASIKYHGNPASVQSRKSDGASVEKE